MAKVRTSRRSEAWLAASRVTDAFVEASIAGEELPFPNGSRVIASDLVTDEMVCESHEHGQTVVIVDEYENVTVLPAPDPSLGERESERFWREILAHW